RRRARRRADPPVRGSGGAAAAGRGGARDRGGELHVGAVRRSDGGGVFRCARHGRRLAVSARPDLLVLSLGTTMGLRIADAQFAALARQAGASVALAGVRIGLTDRLRRGYPVNDLVEAIAARRALDAALRRHAPRAVVLSTTTAALLARTAGVPFAVWLDSPARLNRAGHRNALLHLLERRRLAQARLVLPLRAAPGDALPPGPR